MERQKTPAPEGMRQNQKTSRPCRDSGGFTERGQNAALFFPDYVPFSANFRSLYGMGGV
jgi:hypothetical protein